MIDLSVLVTCAHGGTQLRERDGKSAADMAFETGCESVLELLHLK